MHTPLVSIVIAAYRSRPDHLSAAIVSALSQSWREIEIIVSDDSPDDGLRRLVSGFRDERLHYVHNLPALGVARNHWVSFGKARGEYIAVLNHDDWLAPQFVERLVGVLQGAPEATLAFCDHWVIDVAGRRMQAETDSNTLFCGRAALSPGLHQPFVRLVGEQTIPMAMGAVFRRSALPGQLPAEAGPAYDLWLTYLLSCTGGGAWYVKERLSAWRTHDTSLSSGGGIAWLKGAATCWSRVAGDARFADIRNDARKKAAQGFYACATRSWAGGRRLDCVRYAGRSLGAMLTLKGVLACLLPLLPKRLAPLRWVRGQGVA
jgi:glycosyltransferase involved in cell wall biosynthesis